MQSLELPAPEQRTRVRSTWKYDLLVKTSRVTERWLARRDT